MEINIDCCIIAWAGITIYMTRLLIVYFILLYNDTFDAIEIILHSSNREYLSRYKCKTQWSNNPLKNKFSRSINDIDALKFSCK